MTQTPQLETPTNYRLRGDLSRVSRDGATHDRWQHKPTLKADAPVKRLDNMSMAWGIEARVPFLDHELVELAASALPELKAAQGGKGVLKDLGRQLLPTAVVDRPKGYFAVPALRHLEEPFLSIVRDVLHAPEAKQRVLFRPGYIDALLADPNTQRTPVNSNVLWQFAVLEMWLQHHGVG